MRPLLLCLVMVLFVGGCTGRESKLPPSSALLNSGRAATTPIPSPPQDSRSAASSLPIQLTAVHFIDAAHGWLAGIHSGCSDPANPPIQCRGLLLYTDDGGNHWSQKYEGDVAPLSLNFVSPQTGWAAGGSAAADIWVSRDQKRPGVVLQTQDGGHTWAPIYTAPGGALLSIQFLDPETGWMTNNDGKLFKTKDGGHSWAQANLPCADWVRVVDSRTGFALCGFSRNPGLGMAAKSLLGTADGGEHWNLVAASPSEAYLQQPGKLPLSGYSSGLHFRTPKDGWIALSRGGLIYSHDGGKSWGSLIEDLFPKRTPVVDGVDYSEAGAVQFLTATRGYAILGRSFLVTTDDGGRTWHVVFSPSTITTMGPYAQPQPTARSAAIQINGETYTMQLPDGAPDRLLAIATADGIVWDRPQAETGEELGKHPTEPAKLYLSAFRTGGGDLSAGAQALFTFPLIIPYDVNGQDQYVQVIQMAPAGDWVAVMLYLHLPGAAQGMGRLDAVNVKTREHRVITDAWLSGGMFFDWRVEPNRVYWEQRATTTDSVRVVASKAMDLSTGKIQDVPPGTAKQP